jgi:hypothetical protein
VWFYKLHHTTTLMKSLDKDIIMPKDQAVQTVCVPSRFYRLAKNTKARVDDRPDHFSASTSPRRCDPTFRLAAKSANELSQRPITACEVWKFAGAVWERLFHYVTSADRVLRTFAATLYRRQTVVCMSSLKPCPNFFILTDY